MHKVIVAKIDKTIPIPSADRIHTGIVLGQQVVVAKDWKEGMVGVFFEPDLQLSDDFCRYNNLYRNSQLNSDTNQKGFFDENRRVRCQPFLKVKSEGFFTSLDSLAWCGGNHYMDLTLGDQFDELNGWKVCQKYYSPKTKRAMENATKNGKKSKAIETPLFHKHVNTDQFRYYVGKIPKGALLSFHAKVHGTSGRYSYTKVVRKPTTIGEKIADFFGRFESERWEYIVGTRNVTLYEHENDKQGFHGTEQFRFDVMESLKPHLEKGMTIYVELAGFANGSPIMGRHSTKILKDKKFIEKYGDQVVYKYGCLESELRFHIYRITYTNEEGYELDFTDQQVHHWCMVNNLLGPIEIHPPFIYNGDEEELVNLVDQLTEREDVLTEDYIDPSHPSEGIIIRVDHEHQIPKFYKNKSYVFKVMEGIFKENNVDLEDAS